MWILQTLLTRGVKEPVRSAESSDGYCGNFVPVVHRVLSLVSIVNCCNVHLVRAAGKGSGSPVQKLFGRKEVAGNGHHDVDGFPERNVADILVDHGGFDNVAVGYDNIGFDYVEDTCFVCTVGSCRASAYMFKSV